MFGFGSLLKSAYRIVSPPAGDIPPITIWGDEWAEGSVADLWYPCNWSNVSDDELVLLLPSLTARNTVSSLSDSLGPARYLRRALLARLRWATFALGSCPNCVGGSQKDALRYISQTGVITTLDAMKKWDDSASAYAQMYSGDLAGQSRTRFAKRLTDPQDEQSRVAYELTVLSCLDRVLVHCASPDRKIGRLDDNAAEFGLPEVLVASIHSGLNAGYVYPELASSHELYMLGAWIGHLHRGRPAIMPYFIAENVMERLSGASWEEDGPTASRLVRLLSIFAEMSVGQKRLLRSAKRVLSTGEPVVIRPRNIGPSSYSHLLSCLRPPSTEIGHTARVLTN